MKLGRRRCRCCGKPFLPQAQNAWHQRYCSVRECQAASHRASHRRWLRRNPGANGGPENVLRVRQWRSEHPRHGSPRLARHLFVDVRVPAGGAERRIAVRIEDRQVGTLRDVHVTQPAEPRHVGALSVESLREVIRSGFRNWYQGRHRNKRAPPAGVGWRRQESHG